MLNMFKEIKEDGELWQTNAAIRKNKKYSKT